MKTKPTTIGLLTFFSLGGGIWAQQATLEAPPSGIVSEKVEVNYSGPGDEGDEMTIGTATGVELRGTNPADLSGDGKGTVNLLMPSLPGLYTIIYRGDEGVLATKKIEVTASEFELSAPASASVGRTVQVLWKGVTQGAGLVALRNPDGSVVTSQEIPAEISSGSVALELPATPGQFELSLLDGQSLLASQPIIVRGATETNLTASAQVYANQSFSVSFSGPFNPRDRIVIVPEEPSDAPIVSYAYFNPARGTVALTAPSEPGYFQVQYRTQQGEVLASTDVQVLAAPEQLSRLVVTAEGDYELSESASLEIILDASGSMLQDQSGEDRIDIAKDTLLEFLKTSVPPGMPVALRAFGHIEEGSCESELLIPLAPFDYEGMAPIVKEIEAINLAKTPLAGSLKMVNSDLSAAKGERIVILLTDGEETCDGNPTEVIRSLAGQGVDVRVDIVGYAIEDPDVRQNFESWAAIGNGRYFNASKAEELTLALDDAVSMPFSLYDGTRLIASGVTGETVLEVPPGNYQVAFRREGKQVRKSIVVNADGTTRVTLP